MTHIYFDESGDLGFDFSKQGTSDWFSIAFLLVENKRPISKLVKNVFKLLPPSAKHRGSGILHARYEKASTIKKLLNGLATKDIKVTVMRLDKRKVFIAGNPNDLYTSIVISLINRLYADGIFDSNEQINLIASQRNTSRILNKRFSEDVLNTFGTRITVSIIKPADDKCLQATDFVSWAFWQKYANGDSTFVDLVADKILYEYEMYR